MNMKVKILFQTSLLNNKELLDQYNNSDFWEIYIGENDNINYDNYDLIIYNVDSKLSKFNELYKYSSKIILLSEKYEDSVYNEYFNNNFYDYILINELTLLYIKKKVDYLQLQKANNFSITNDFFRLLNLTQQNVYIVNESGKIIYHSAKFLNHLEYSSEEFKNIKIYDFDNSIKNQNELKIIFESLDNNSITINSIHKTKNGTIKYVEETISKIIFGNIQFCLFCITDLTELKSLKEKYEIINEKFLNIFFNKHSVMLIIHPETGKIIDVNEAAEKFYGINRETFINNTYIYDFNYDKSISSLKDYKIAAIKGHNIFFARHITKEGSIKEVQISAGKINLRGKELIFSVINDVTEKINYAKEVEIFKTVFNQSPLSIIITNNYGKIIYINEAFIKIYGYEFSEVHNKSPKFLYPINTDDFKYKEMWQTILSGQNWSNELLTKKKNGELIWQSLSIASIKDEFGTIKYFVIISEDITDKKELIRQLKLSKIESEKANKIKTEFLIQLSYELRNPLNILINLIDYTYDDNKNLNQDDQIIYNSAVLASERIKKIVDSLSEMAVLNSNQYYLKYEPVKIFQDIISPLYIEQNKYCQSRNNKFVIEKNFNEIIIATDKHCLYQIINNVVDNAIKFTSNGIINLKVIRNKKDLEFQVSDNGIGISEEFLPKVFDDFSQEQKGYNRAYEGNGIGLALVKKYSKLINAELFINSEKNIGTNFIIKLKDVIED